MTCPQVSKKLAILLTIICSTVSTATSVRSEDECSLPTLPGIDVSEVKIVKNSSSRDKKIEQYIRTEHTDELNYKGSVSYSYNKVDLDGDGKPEILLRVSSSFCGTGGCPIEILKLNGGRYSVISSFLSFGRFIVTSNRTNGLNDIVLPHFAQTEKEYFLLKYQSSKKRYVTLKTYTNNLKVKGTAYLVCGKYHDLSK
jgi:hypothetical protein